MQIQTGVIAFRSPTGEFVDEEPIFENVEVAEELEDDTGGNMGCSPIDTFVKYIVNKINTEGMCKND